MVHSTGSTIPGRGGPVDKKHGVLTLKSSQHRWDNIPAALQVGYYLFKVQCQRLRSLYEPPAKSQGPNEDTASLHEGSDEDVLR